MTDSQYFGTTRIWQNLNEHHYYLILTTSVVRHLPLNILPFHIRLVRLKLTYYSLASIFSKYYFKTATLCFLLSSHVFTALAFSSNYFGVLFSKIVKAHYYNEIKRPIGKIFQKCKPMRHQFVMSQSE